MNIKFIIIVLGEPYSIFSEILGKYFSKNKKIKKKIVLIGNMSLLKKQLNKLNYFLPLNKINNISETEKTKINIIDEVTSQHRDICASFIIDPDWGLQFDADNTIVLRSYSMNKKLRLNFQSLGKIGVSCTSWKIHKNF